jgi:hypothetical protein
MAKRKSTKHTHQTKDRVTRTPLKFACRTNGCVPPREWRKFYKRGPSEVQLVLFYYLTEHCNILTEQIGYKILPVLKESVAFPKPLIEKFLHTFIFLSYKIMCIASDMYSAPYKHIIADFFRSNLCSLLFFAHATDLCRTNGRVPPRQWRKFYKSDVICWSFKNIL